MSKLVHLSILLVAAAVLLTDADDNKNPQQQVTEKEFNGIRITLERPIPQPSPAREHRRHNIVSSAARGVGRLLRNVTIEAGKFVGTVGKGAYRFTKRTAGAHGNTAVDATNRVLPRSFRTKLQPKTPSSVATTVDIGGSQPQHPDTKTDAT